MKYITDTDFITKQVTGDEYNLVYGIIQHSAHKSDLKDKYIYNLICALCNNQSTPILRKYNAKKWIALLDSIIKNLQHYKNDILVTIPFCNIYDRNIAELIESFELASYILTEFNESNFVGVEPIESIKQAYPIQSLEDLFSNLILNVEVKAIVNKNNEDIDVSIITDEIIRRNIKYPGIKKSDKYDENRYYSTFIGEATTQTNATLPEDDDDSPVKITVLRRIGVLYYMLHDLLRNDINRLVKVAAYVTDKDYDENNKANSTAYTYIHHPEKFSSKTDNKNYIKEQLRRYSIDIPSDLDN
jgi:hypothetical protein